MCLVCCVFIHASIADVLTLRKATFGPPYPYLKDLILTHNLQTEVKSKVNALKKRLQKEPAFPDGSPARRTIMGACQIATQACHFRPKRTHRHGSRRVTRTLGQHRQHQRINHRIRRTLWFFTSGRTNLRTAARQEATTDPSLRIRPSTGGPCRSSM